MRFHNKLLKHILNWGIKSSIFLLLLVVVFSPLGAISQTPLAQAVLAPSQPPSGTTITNQQAYANCLASPGANAGTCASQTNYTPPATGNGSCSTFSECIATVVYVFTVGLGTLLAYIAGYFFNLAVYISLNGTAYALTFLTQGWSSVRDIANMGFIFILIYIAVTVIISAETGKTMSMLVKVVAIALVINFSFFFTRVVIDGGNILAVNFYNATTQTTMADSLKNSAGYRATGAGPGASSNTVTVSLSGATKNAKDLTAGIMDAIKIQTILNDTSFKAFSQNSDFFTVLITLSFTYICVGVIFGLLAAMFFTIGIKFITRVAVLWIVIISAPIALLMYAVPNGNKYFKEWLNALITYSLYPAIFLFLYLLVINFTYSLAGSSGSLVGNIFADINQTTSTGLSFMLGVIATISIKLGFVMVLLYLIMQASNTVSKLGGSMAQKITARPDKIGASLAGFSRRFSTSGVNFGYRNTVGRAGVALDNSLRVGRLSGIGNSKALNNWLVGHPVTALRENVILPAAKVGIGGNLGRVDYDKQYNDKEKERRANILTANTKEFSNKLGTTVEANIKAGKKPEEGIEKPDMDRLHNISESRMKEMSANQLKTLSNVFTENQMKVVDKLEKMSEQDKEIAKKNFDTHSPNSPVRKAQKQLEELRKINGSLSALYRINKVEEKLGSEGAPKTGITINVGVAEEMLNAKDTGINAKIAKLDSDIAKQPKGSDTSGLRQEKNLLLKAVKAVEKLTDETKNIRAGVGGEKDPGNFKS